MALDPDQIVSDLTALLGADGVLGARDDMAPFLEEPRRRFHRPALAVARPRNVAQVQEIVRWAGRTLVPLIPQGGNTGLVGGQVPLVSGEPLGEVIVSLARLDAVRHLDATAGHMTLEAGVTLQEAQDIAGEAGALFPLSIASQGSARIGGVLASNAGGVQVLAYGNARQLCLGVEAVMADGALYQGLNALRKNNTGYDLSNLLVGSEGTLGIITAATLKLFPAPAAHETALVNVPSPEAALALFAHLRDRSGPRLTGFELIARIGIELQVRHGALPRDPAAEPSPWHVLVELSLPDGAAAGELVEGLDAAFEEELVTNAVIAESLGQRALLWQAREQLSEIQSREGASLKHDVSVPVARVPELIARGTLVAEAIVPGIRPVPFGHLGDGNIHFNFSQPVGTDPAGFMEEGEAIHEAIHALVVELDGSVSAEHGIGQLKSGLLERVKDPVALSLMRAIKTALDPKGILNPGKVLERR